MVMSVTLPNGVIMKGVPDGTSQIDIAKHAISKGYAEPIDFEAYPAIYSELTANKKQPEIKSTSGSGFAQKNGDSADRLSEQSREMQQSNPLASAYLGYSAMLADTGKSIDEHPQVAATAASIALAPVTGGMSIPSAYAIDAGSQLAVDSAAHTLETSGEDAMPEHPFADAIIPIPGVARLISKPVSQAIGIAAKAARPVISEIGSIGEDIGVNSLLRRFSPRTAATVKGLADGGALDEASEREVDAVPRGEKITTVEQGADRAVAEQALYDQKFMEFATRLHSSIEGTSYAGAALKAAKTGAGGQDARNAINFYRMAVSPYESSVIPREALLEGRGDLNDAPYFEALMRTDSAELDNLISKIDKGEEVNPAHFLDALEAYQVNQTAQIKAYAKRLPQHYAEDLRELARGMPDVDKFLSDAARMGRSTSKVAPKVSRDYQQGFTLAIKDYANGVEKSLRDEADRITEDMAKLQREQKNNPRLKAVITAMSHSHDTLEKMADNIQYGLEKGTMRGGVSADDVGMLRSMAATHDAAEHLEELYLKYRQIESGFAALPAARSEMEAAPLTERLIDAAELGLTIKTLGGNRAAKAIAPKTISGPVSKIRKTIERRQALKEINKLIEKTK
ncbi:hypothetical protein E0U70_06840 [Salmonella enterica subsp. enterica serovar Gloucester]|nr:hypothetical protein [Salmonella enterica subsp. enterica serovar Gloucester]